MTILMNICIIIYEKCLFFMILFNCSEFLKALILPQKFQFIYIHYLQTIITLLFGNQLPLSSNILHFMNLFHSS